MTILTLSRIVYYTLNSTKNVIKRFIVMGVAGKILNLCLACLVNNLKINLLFVYIMFKNFTSDNTFVYLLKHIRQIF